MYFLAIVVFFASVYVFYQGGFTLQSQGKFAGKLYQFQCVLKMQDEVEQKVSILEYKRS